MSAAEKWCVRCTKSVATERGKSVPYTGAPLCAGCAAVLAQDDEQDRRCPDCQTWLDRYGNCPQCRESEVQRETES